LHLGAGHTFIQLMALLRASADETQTTRPNGLACRPSLGQDANIVIDVENVLAEALRLPAEARAAVAADLIQSFDEPEHPPEEVEAA
jgi:hypothetical protein